MNNKQVSENSRVRVSKLAGVDLLVVEKLSKRDSLFYTNEKAIAISTANFSRLLLFLVINEYISPNILEGILEEYYSNN